VKEMEGGGGRKRGRRVVLLWRGHVLGLGWYVEGEGEGQGVKEREEGGGEGGGKRERKEAPC
jgi:hypothetical protein